MSLEMITAIKQEENRADEMIREAQQKSKQILKDASDRAYRLLSDQEEQTEAEVEQIIAAGADGATGECGEIVSEARRNTAVIRNSAGAVMDKAVKLVINRLSE